ncbi:carboxypeptidase-like regulatory domain-containing protein [Polaribacter uvawellassae]|uniref:carboxypeptidase-like regulatory domain-containing protein n=1 Tax=Polaribacter uvawellassae TaxID=3133495 RepID=UPI003219E2F1
MKKWFLLFVFMSFQLVGQQSTFKGKLLDAKTKEPVVYANISFIETTKGISTTEDGAFFMNISEKYLEGKVHISCLNYKDTIVNASDINKKTLFMIPKENVIDEVVISKRVDKSILIDKIKRKVHGVHTVGMRMLAKYFPNTKKNECCNYVSKVAIYFSKRHNKKSKFRVRVFDRDEITGLPKNDLLNVNLPVTISEGQLQTEINLSNYSIEMPKNGLFIAFEKLYIPFNKYGNDIEGESDLETLYAPVIGFTKYNYKKPKERTYYYVKGNWRKSEFTKISRFRKFAPAISLTLSN